MAKRGAGAERDRTSEADFRFDALTRMPVVINPRRQSRPDHPTEGCPFCPGGVEAPEGEWETHWFANRFPPLPDRRSEIVIYDPDHDTSLATMGPARVRPVVDTWVERTRAMAARPEVSYVLIFENRGDEVGATIDHPHCQIYAFDQVPPTPLRELTGSCALCRPPGSGMVVGSRGDWLSFVPSAAAYPYELRLTTGTHLGSFLDLTDRSRDDLSWVLADAVARLDQLFDQPMPYMMWWHQTPTKGTWPLSHLHCHITPYLRAAGVGRYVAAGELGSGVWFNPVIPEEAASRLRALPGWGNGD